MKKLNFFLDKVFFKKILSITLLFFIFILFIFGFRAYLGNKLIYLLFTIISTCSLFYGFRKKSIFFDNFISILLWLGFWSILLIQQKIEVDPQQTFFYKALSLQAYNQFV